MLCREPPKAVSQVDPKGEGGSWAGAALDCKSMQADCCEFEFCVNKCSSRIYATDVKHRNGQALGEHLGSCDTEEKSSGTVLGPDIFWEKNRNTVIHTAGPVRRYNLPSTAITLPSPLVFGNIKGEETCGNKGKIISQCQPLYGGKQVGGERQLQSTSPFPDGAARCGVIKAGFRKRQELACFPLLTTSLQRNHCGFDLSASQLKKYPFDVGRDAGICGYLPHQDNLSFLPVIPIEKPLFSIMASKCWS